jgi:hypothetical protein
MSEDSGESRAVRTILVLYLTSSYNGNKNSGRIYNEAQRLNQFLIGESKRKEKKKKILHQNLNEFSLSCQPRAVVSALAPRTFTTIFLLSFRVGFISGTGGRRRRSWRIARGCGRIGRGRWRIFRGGGWIWRWSWRVVGTARRVCWAGRTVTRRIWRVLGRIRRITWRRRRILWTAWRVRRRSWWKERSRLLSVAILKKKKKLLLLL